MTITTWALVRVRGNFAKIDTYPTKEEAKAVFDDLYEQAEEYYDCKSGYLVTCDNGSVYTVRYYDTQLERVDVRPLEIR